MKTKELVLLALLIAMGTVLHLVIPGIGGGMKPDMLLVMMFLGIILFPKAKYVLLVGIASGIMSALTTNMPGGQLPNIIDKFLTAFIFFGLFMAIKKLSTSIVPVAVLTAVGTFVSGMIFLGTALFIVELPNTFLALTVGIVLPTVALNTIVMVIIYPIAMKLTQRLQVKTNHVNI
ncbi:tryptophan transporter TrpP [Bacillus carboniphilus]|uniref:Tryptophan transporter TrpP n=1 Tax=Bacillus carboniphilus TaxID=86663 RepID=A0ABN0VPI6_9BACI